MPPSLPPTLQGIKWIKSREASSGLVILQQSQPKYVDKVLSCIEQVRGVCGCALQNKTARGPRGLLATSFE